MGNSDSVGFALFCIFVRNRISVMVIVAEKTVAFQDITGFLMLLKPDIVCIYLMFHFRWIPSKFIHFITLGIAVS
ncbi:MAG: hypothetical protein KJO26_16305 [Deltaproteobacteria bacterium]|nr:hypothetical protein [Deltaproteobacteria bacterium]